MHKVGSEGQSKLFQEVLLKRKELDDQFLDLELDITKSHR